MRCVQKFGFSTCEELFGGSREEYLKYNYYKNYDYITVSSPEVIWAYQEAMNLPKEGQKCCTDRCQLHRSSVPGKFQKAAQKKLYDICPAAKERKSCSMPRRSAEVGSEGTGFHGSLSDAGEAWKRLDFAD